MKTNLPATTPDRTENVDIDATIAENRNDV